MGRKRKDRAASKHRKSVKRANKLKKRRSEAATPSAARALALARALRDQLRGEDWYPRPWACTTHFTLAAAEHTARTRTLADGTLVHPYVVAKLREMTNWTEPGWMLDRMRETATETIVDRLAAAGVRTDPATFAAQAADHRSAWALSETWDAPGADADFLGLSACELWRRWCPDRPSLEMADDLVQEGYDLLDHFEETSAWGLWRVAWEVVLEALPEGTSLEQAQGSVPALQHLGTWLTDTLDMLWNLHDDGEIPTEEALAWCRQMAGRFPERLGSIRETEAEILLDAGQGAAAEALLRMHLDDDPDDRCPT